MLAKDSTSHKIAQRAAQEIKPGDFVNLGVGIPTLVADYFQNDANTVFLQTENGQLGVGPSPMPGTEDLYLVNASKLPVTEMIGASYFSSADSFGMIRGGHIGVAILGVLQVNRLGQIANWAVPGKAIMGVGGAMDLLVGAKKIIVTTTHMTKDGKPKIVDQCSYPLSGTRKVDLIITDYATFSVDEEGLILEELASEVTLEQVEKNTDAPFRQSATLKIRSLD